VKATPSNLGSCGMDRRISTHSGSLTSWSVRSIRSSASIVKMVTITKQQRRVMPLQCRSSVRSRLLQFRHRPVVPLNQIVDLAQRRPAFCCARQVIPPDYFVATPAEARPRVKEYTTRGILTYGSVNTAKFQNRWDKIESAVKAARPATTK